MRKRKGEQNLLLPSLENGGKFSCFYPCRRFIFEYPEYNLQGECTREQDLQSSGAEKSCR